MKLTVPSLPRFNFLLKLGRRRELLSKDRELWYFQGMKTLQPQDSVPFVIRWMFRPVDVPNEAGLPETYPLLEVPDSLLIKLSFAAWFCFLAGIIGVFGWPYLIAASILITFTIHLAVNQQNQIWRNADERFHRPHPPETTPPKCD